MRIMFFLAICSALFFAACAEKSDDAKIRASVPKEKMISVLIDIHLLEARAEEFKDLTDTFITAKRAAYDSIFEKHGVSRTDFMNTFDYYETNPDKMDVLYETVVDSFSVMEANVVKKEMKEVKSEKKEAESE